MINHLSQGVAPADIMHGAIVSLVGRSVQLMKRVQMEPEFTLIGGILRFETMARVIREQLESEVNVPPGDLVQFVRLDRRGDPRAVTPRDPGRRTAGPNSQPAACLMARECDRNDRLE